MRRTVAPLTRRNSHCLSSSADMTHPSLVIRADERRRVKAADRVGPDPNGGLAVGPRSTSSLDYRVIDDGSEVQFLDKRHRYFDVNNKGPLYQCWLFHLRLSRMSTRSRSVAFSAGGDGGLATKNSGLNLHKYGLPIPSVAADTFGNSRKRPPRRFRMGSPSRFDFRL